MTSKEEIAAAVAAAREAARGVATQGPMSGTAVNVEHGKLIEGEMVPRGEDVPVMDMSAYREKYNREMEGVPHAPETLMAEKPPTIKEEARPALKVIVQCDLMFLLFQTLLLELFASHRPVMLNASSIQSTEGLLFIHGRCRTDIVTGC